jgi:hypothetical protein
MFRQRTAAEIVLQMISIKADHLKDTRYAKTMPHITQELLEFSIQAIRNWIVAPTSVAQACKKTIADDRMFHEKLNKPFKLPKDYQQLLEEIVAMVAFLCHPVGGFVREEDRQELSKLIASLEQKV